MIEGHAFGTKAEELHEKLSSTPEVLDELYGDILSGVTGPGRHQMTKLFQWVLFAERPLSAHDLRDALATDKAMGHTTYSELMSHKSWTDNLDDFERHVKHISRGLVEFTVRDIWEQYEPGEEDSNREAQFIHQSVADYVLSRFLSRDEHYSLPFRIGDGHFEISRSCLKYIMLREVLEGAQLRRGTLCVKFPLLPYAVRFLFNHIQKTEQEGVPQPDLLQLIPWNTRSGCLGEIVSLWRTFDPTCAYTPKGWPFKGATKLHVLVGFGSKTAVNTCLEQDNVEIDSEDSEGNTPLLCAIKADHQDIALAILLKRDGVKLNIKI